MVRIDDLGLEPTFVKIDAQGFEVQAINGMLDTLRRSRPMLLIEGGPDTPSVVEVLTPLGYTQRFWDGVGLSESNTRQSCNFVMLPARL